MSHGGTCTQARKLGSMESNIDNLVGWQKKQNGSIQKTEEKVDKLKQEFSTFKESLLRSNNKLLGGVAVACVLLTINIIITIF